MPSIKPLTPESSPSSELWDYLQQGGTVESPDVPSELGTFCTQYISTEKGEPYELRPYLADIMSDHTQQIVLTKGRQVGASTLMAAMIIHAALLYPRTMHLFVSDTLPHARDFARLRLRPIIRDTGLVPEIPKKDDLVMQITLPNRSNIILMGAHNEYRQARGYSPDFVYLDEAQLTELDAIPSLLEGMAKSKYGRAVIAGTGAPEGSAWESMWLDTTMSEWDGSEWHKQNPNSDTSGYHITQLMAGIPQSVLDMKRRKYSTSQYVMEVEGGFATGAEIPLTASDARKVYYKSEMILPTQKRDLPTYATLDLAHGGEAYTVLTISQYAEPEDMVHVLATYAYNDSRNGPLANKILKVVNDYQSDAVISDAGGNLDLLQRLRDRTQVLAFKSGPQIDDHIKYTHADADLFPISKSYFMERTIDRVHRQQIRIPDCEDTMPWTIEHLTAERAELREPKGGQPYTQYEHQPNRPDDFLQSLMFLEAYLYTKSDPANPQNRPAHFSFGDTMPKSDV